MQRDHLKIKNVVGVGDGEKRSGGVNTKEDAIIFFVTQKDKNISREDAIPSEIDGKKTDVVEVGNLREKLLHPCNVEVYRKNITPMRGGLQVQSELLNAIGTMGAIVKDRISGKLYGLTNAHVAGNPLSIPSYLAEHLSIDDYEYTNATTAIGSDIYQSDKYNGNNIGTVKKDAYRSIYGENQIDASVFSINSSVGVTAGILGLTKFPQYFVHPDNVPVGTKVYKSGRTSGVTSGEIYSKNATVAISITDQVEIVLENQIVAISESSAQFIEDGDSGSALCIDMENGVAGIVGLASAGSDVTDGYSTLVASRIDNIVSTFDIVPWDGAIITNSSSDIISTGFGSVYTEDSATFLSSTNDYVCASSDSLTDNILECIDGNLVVQRSEHSTRSFDKYNMTGKLNLSVKVTDVRAQSDALVELRVNSEARVGARLNTGVAVKAEISSVSRFDFKYDATIGIELLSRLSGRTQLQTPFFASTDSNIRLSISPTISANTDILAKPDIDVWLNTGSDASAFILGNTLAVSDMSIPLQINILSSETVAGQASNNTVTVLDDETYDSTILKYGAKC